MGLERGRGRAAARDGRVHPADGMRVSDTAGVSFCLIRPEAPVAPGSGTCKVLNGKR